MAEKLVIAPQIVVYKNLFKHSKELIEELEFDKEDSVFSKWNPWYEQGYRKDCSFRLDASKDNLETLYLKEIVDLIEYIKKDYFAEFGENKGIWPSFVKDWDSLVKKNNISYLDYFKYDKRSYNEDDTTYKMEYHVDDFLLESNANGMRHVITINFYLNDEYDRGEICAYDSSSGKSYKYKPKPGDAVVMPSTKPFYHAVKNFNKDRYFLRSFVDYHVAGEIDWEKMIKEQHEYVLNDMQIVKIKSEEEEVF
jgi:hypothetical protein